MMHFDIPFNRPCFEGKELTYIGEAIRSGMISGDGAFTVRCQRLLEERLGVARALLTSSCTDALEMAAIVLDVDKGDEVIMPSFTFVSTANAFALRGAKPVFVDIRPDTLNLDENQIEKHLNEHTRAIVPVHYAGVGCEMDAIMDLASTAGVSVIEDNAHGIFGAYRGRPLGSCGQMGTLSFHETKTITCGEGGALLLNDSTLIERAEIIRDKGTNRAQFFRGEVDKYRWVDLGSSFLPSDVLAAFLYAQLECADAILAARRAIWDRYFEKLEMWAGENGVRLPVVPEHCRQAYHMFYLIMPDQERRAALIDHLKLHGILSVFHYLPLHLSPMGRHLGGKPGDCPVTEDLSERLLRLPFYNDMTQEEQDRVIAAVQAFT